jgi:Tfp pilus assembly protein PilP
MTRILLISLLAAAGCRTVVDKHIERNSTEVYEIEKQRLAELAPAYDAERMTALQGLSQSKPFSADMIATSKSIADKTAAGLAYRRQEAQVEAAEFRLVDATQRLGPPYGKTAKEMELARQTDEDDRLISALKGAAAKQ